MAIRPTVGTATIGGRPVGDAAIRRGRGAAAADVAGRRGADLFARAAVAAGAAAAGHAARGRGIAHPAGLNAAAVIVREAAAPAIHQTLGAGQLGLALGLVGAAGNALDALLLGRIADQRGVTIGVEQTLHAAPVRAAVAEIAE